MSLTAEQIVASHKATLETLFGLTNKTFRRRGKAGRTEHHRIPRCPERSRCPHASRAEREGRTRTAGPASQRARSLAEKTAAYSRHLYDIASGTGAEFSKAVEAKATESQKAFVNLVDNAAKNAPAGSETAVAMFKSAVSAANNAVESVQKAVKQATDVAEANFAAVSESAVSAAKTTTKKR